MQGFTPEDALKHGKQFPKKSAFSAPLMKIPISAKIPRPYGPPPLQKGRYWGISRRWSRLLRLIFMRGVVPIGT
jgi:hypothetical protein